MPHAAGLLGSLCYPSRRREAAPGSVCRTACHPVCSQEIERAMPIGAPELIIILVIALLILGPGKLPEVGASLGKTIREFRKASTDIQDAVKVDTSPLPPTTQASQAPSQEAVAPPVAPVGPVTAPETPTAAAAAPMAAPETPAAAPETAAPSADASATAPAETVASGVTSSAEPAPRAE